MLTNFDIEDLTKKFSLPIVGVFSKDELKGRPRIVGSYYINLMDSNKTDGEGNNGSHWVFFKIYPDDEDSEELVDIKVCYSLYFDPFGFGMPLAVSDFLRPFKPVYCNNREIQSINTTECGWYCIACDFYTENRDEDKMLYCYANFLSSFSDNPKNNLSKLEKFFKSIGQDTLYISNN